MNAYTSFAAVYDSFMSHIPYEEWAELIDKYLKKNDISGDVLELGCGTGRFAFLLEQKGYTITGIDNSPQMIHMAVKNAKRNKSKAVFCLQDMRVIELDAQYDAVISVCDSMNYILEEFDLQSVFEGVLGVLKQDGIFIFDMKTESYYKSLGDNVFTDDNELGSYIWKNSYDEVSRDNFYELTFFIRKRGNLYTKEIEEHIQHVFTEAEIRNAADKAGLCVREIFSMDSEASADYDAQRIYYVLERRGDKDE